MPLAREVKSLMRWLPAGLRWVRTARECTKHYWRSGPTGANSVNSRCSEANQQLTLEVAGGGMAEASHDSSP
jgi:hypothetical protein